MKMTAGERKAWLAAIRKLLRYYEAMVNGKNIKPEFYEWPLCCIDGDAGCATCLWQKFNRAWCYAYAIKKFGDTIGVLSTERSLPWARDSIRRLRRWEKRLKEV